MVCQSRNPVVQVAKTVAKSAGLRRVAAKGLGRDSRTVTNNIDCHQRLQELATARHADVGSPPEAAPQRPKDSREPISPNLPPVQPKHGLQAADASLEACLVHRLLLLAPRGDGTSGQFAPRRMEKGGDRPGMQLPVVFGHLPWRWWAEVSGTSLQSEYPQGLDGR